jgi:hypothetical protein
MHSHSTGPNPHQPFSSYASMLPYSANAEDTNMSQSINSSILSDGASQSSLQGYDVGTTLSAPPASSLPSSLMGPPPPPSKKSYSGSKKSHSTSVSKGKKRAIPASPPASAASDSSKRVSKNSVSRPTQLAHYNGKFQPQEMIHGIFSSLVNGDVISATFYKPTQARLEALFNMARQIFEEDNSCDAPGLCHSISLVSI